MLNSLTEYIKTRMNIIRLFSLPSTQTEIVKRLAKMRQQKGAFKFDMQEKGLCRMPLLVHVFAACLFSPAHDQIVFHKRFQIYTGTCGRASTRLQRDQFDDAL